MPFLKFSLKILLEDLLMLYNFKLYLEKTCAVIDEKFDTPQTH